MTTVMDFPPALLLSFDTDTDFPPLRPVGTVLPRAFSDTPDPAAGQYQIYPKHLLPGDYVLAGTNTWLQALDVGPVEMARGRVRYEVRGLSADGRCGVTLIVPSDHQVTVWHPVDILISVLLGETAGAA